jgi:uncharacterized surface protein with fasciclin (FAS1) repeats
MQKNRGNIIVFLIVCLIMVAGGLTITFLSRFEPDRDGLTIVETLAQTPELSEFNALLQKSGILTELDNKDKSFTIFAPTNEAIKAAKKRLDKLSGEAKKEELAKLLRNHIVEEKVYKFSLQTLEELDTISDEVLPVKYNLKDSSVKVGGALVGAKSDITASNGLIQQLGGLVEVKRD